MAGEKKQGAQNSAPKTSPQGGGRKSEKFTVVEPFVDKDKFSKRYEVGDDVSHFAPERLLSVVRRGLVKKG